MGNIMGRYSEEELEAMSNKKVTKEGMKKQLEMLETFQKKFNSDFNDSPTLINNFKLRYELLKEENEEYLEAAENNDLVEVTDALGDQLYIVLGTIVSHGLQHIIEDVLDEIHRSNLSKLNEEGEPIINDINGFDETRPKGKILKSKNYFKPNLKQFLK